MENADPSTGTTDRPFIDHHVYERKNSSIPEDGPSSRLEDHSRESRSPKPTSVQYFEESYIDQEKSRVDHDVDGMVEFLRQFIKDNGDDLNFPSSLLQKATAALKIGVPTSTIIETAEAVRVELKLGEENSPYPEVRACVDPTDDVTLPVLTFRMWVIGLALVILGTGLNQFFAPRLPGISLSITFAQLVAYPIGLLMARSLPTRIFRFGKRSFTFNPGPFNIKEHMLISIMANASFGGAYATDIIAVLRIGRFYNNVTLGANLGFQILLVISTQLIGYSLAGLTRRFLVYPREMVWWSALLEITVLKALHSQDNNAPVHGWKISQMRFFAFCGIAYGIYFILPDVFFESLSFFNWTTWIAPENIKLALITGTVSGLGLNPLPTLDWNFLSLDPIVTPLWAIINVYIGALAGLVFIAAIYFNNILYTSYLPINSAATFDRKGERYNASKILNEHGILDEALYRAYSPPYMTASNIVLYTAHLALYTSTICHAILHYRKHIMGGFYQLFASWKTNQIVKKIFGTHDPNQSSKGKDLDHKMNSDVHYRLMKSYPEVPETWFLAIGVVSMSLAIFMVEYYSTQMPVWGLFFALGIALVLIVPNGIMQAVASVYAPLNVLSELIGGYALPGRPLANMLFKTYGFICLDQALGFASDMKLAHYVKIPPRATFLAQAVATILSSFVSIAVLNWQVEKFDDLCSPTQPLHFTCPGYNTFFSASILWGAVGPNRLFTGKDAIYKICIYGLPIGIVIPIIPWLAAKKWAWSGWRFLHMPVIIAGVMSYAPLNLAHRTPVIPLALFFQGYVKKRYVGWYEKYALVLSAGLGAGVAVFGLIYFFAFQMNGQTYEWVGNTIYTAGCDSRSCKLMDAPKEGFGPVTWE